MMLYITGKLFFLTSAMQNIPSELIITVKNYINITSFKMKGSPDLGQADKYFPVITDPAPNHLNIYKIGRINTYTIILGSIELP